VTQQKDANQNHLGTLETVVVDHDLIEALFKQKLISDAARRYALNLISPSKNWGAWASRQLLVLGTLFILAGIICFFAFNWVKIPPYMKLASIQIALFGCLGGAYFYGLQHSLGKMLLLSASVLIGVFLAVFGQIYQTGADAYTLFMMWAILMLPFVLISEFAAQWGVWIAVCNISMLIYWSTYFIFFENSDRLTYIALFNIVFWGLREYFSEKGISWLQSRWTRYLLIITILSFMMTPTIEFLSCINFNFLPKMFGLTPARHFVSNPTDGSIFDTGPFIFGFVLSIIIHCTFYIRYRFKCPDMYALAITGFSFCIILELILYRIIRPFIDSSSLTMLIQSAITFLLFVFLFYRLRDTKKLGGERA
jgi:hypothetical protein